MKKEIEKQLDTPDHDVRKIPKETLEDKLIKAEQAYLLATHPVEPMSENFPSVPSSSLWAEPGWHLKLGVNEEDDQGDRILPCPAPQPLVQYNLSELYSAPGRQAASMINSTHLRSLETPLSAVATATSLAETDPAMANPADAILSSNDPLKMTRDALKLGYAFNASSKTQTIRPAATRRKSATVKDTVAASASTKATKKKQAAATLTDASVSKSSGIPATLNAGRADNSRKRKNVAQSDPTPTIRVVQRKRSEPSRQIPVVDEQAFQPRPIMTKPQPQPQQQQQQQPAQSSVPFLQQQIQYNNQMMNAMPSTVPPQQQATHRGSFNQFQNTQQINQFRRMQQQQQQQQQQPHHQQQHQHQHSNQQKVNPAQMQQQFRQNQLFWNSESQFTQQPMQLAGQGGMQMSVKGNNQMRQNMASTDEQNDPLFMLKDM